MKKSLFLLFFLIVFVFTSCGGSETPSGKCTKDSQCKQGESCNTETGKCEIISFKCTNDLECKSGETCNLSSGVCETVSVKCTKDSECKEGEVCNTETGECEIISFECTKDSECETGEICNTDTGECEDSLKCRSNNDCDPGEICNLTTQVCEEVFICSSEQSCYDHDSIWDPESNPVRCVNGECKAKACKSDSNCNSGKFCNVASGECEDPVPCENVEKVKIVTSDVILKEGVTKELKALVLDNNGSLINVNTPLIWTSENTNVVAIDNNGVVTGGTTSGSSDITVSVCDKTSDALNIQNFSTVENGKLRIIVRNIDGNKVVGATVKAKDENIITNNEGVALFDNTEAKNNIMVTMNGFQPVSFLNVAEKDIIVYLDKVIPNDKSGGFKGQFDFDHETIVNNGSVMIGFAGASIPGSVLDLDFTLLLGEPVTKHINLMDSDTDMLLPSGLVLFLGDDVVSDSYTATALEGDRALWGWGGRCSMVQFMGILQDTLDEGVENIDMSKLLSRFMPVTENFNHSIKASQNITLCSKVADINDINGNQDTAELVSDFNSSCFPTVNMTLNQPLSQMSTFKFPELPVIEGERAESEILIISAIVKGKGMLPLGFGAGTDKKNNNDIADGKIDDINMVYAPQHDGILNNDSMVVSIAIPKAKSDTETEYNLTGLVKLYKNGVIEDNIDMSGDTYLKLAEDVTFENNVINFTAIQGATFYRLNILDNNGNNWLVYSSDTSVQITDKPIGDIVKIIVQAVTLIKDNSEINYNELLKFNNSNLDDLVRLISKFSVYRFNLPEK